MARVNKKQAIKNMEGLNGVQPKDAMMDQGGDDVQAVIEPANGGQKQPAALKEGEIVISIPAIIGAGEGDYDKGLEIILATHDKLKAIGEQLLQENSIAGA